MKKIIILLAFVFMGSLAVSAQKIVYVDSDKVLNSLPEYKDAQREIDKVTENWQQEVQKRYENIENLYKAYQAEEVLLTEDMKQRRQDEIIAKEKELKDFQKEKFGYEGALFKKRQELVKPIQDKIYAAIVTLAEQRAYDFVLDKSSGVSVLYADEKFDKTSEVMKALNIDIED